MRLLRRHLDGIARERAGKPSGFEQRLAGNNAGQQARAVQIARSVQHVGDELVVDLEDIAVDAAYEVADFGFSLALDAFQHDVLRALGDESVDDFLSLVISDVGAGPLASEDDGGFGEVRREDVCIARKFGHSLAKFGRVGGVDLAVICHDRVDHAQCLRVGRIDVANDVDLLGSAKEARVHCVDLDVDAFPCGQVVGQDFGRIVHVPTRESSMGAEQTCGHGAHIGTCRRKHWDGNAKRALSITAQIVYCGDAWDVVEVALVERGGMRVLLHGHCCHFPLR